MEAELREEMERSEMSSSRTEGERSRPQFAAPDVHSAVTQFLVYEASLLDEDRMAEWLDLLDEDFVYEIPLRVDRERKQGGNRFAPGSYRMRDSKGALQNRINRLNTGHAWVEELASRTCRLVGAAAVTTTDRPSVVRAQSAVFIYRQRGDQRDFDIIPARHEDEILIDEGSMRLLKRRVLLTEKCLSTNNLAIVI
jgi:3-phenylpropionate/cinnamic acid dioxygenase small subunit